ncbi:LURP-one-related/scramblase family protein [Leptolyngbya ohadii]|uniref:LURP-one-related/scramblase family protein n=1 Tax=Leptolyngbya ohadii TaxID=1962290 RepID=UPI000B59F745|nr:LURP-one-related family protein [Leptolyngbya ohadii]
MFDRARERREQRREEREVFGIRGTATRYRMRQSLISIGDNFWIENDRGERTFKVDGKMLRVRDTLYLEDMQGNVLCKIQQKLLSIRDTMTIEADSGESLATIKKALISPIRERWTVKIGNGPDLTIKGNVLDFEYEIDDGDRKVAEVSKKWFRLTDTYGVQIEPSQNDVLILAATVAIDMMSHP